MLRDSAYESNEENTDIVKRGNPAEAMDNNPEDIANSMAKTTESYNAPPQVVTAGIILAIGISLFTVSAKIFWIWKKQMEQKNSLDDKTVLVDHDDQRNKNFERKDEKRKGQSDQTNETEEILDNIPLVDKKAEHKNHIDSFKHDFDGGRENLTTVDGGLLSVDNTTEITRQDCPNKYKCEPVTDSIPVENSAVVSGVKMCTNGAVESLKCITASPTVMKDNTTRRKSKENWPAVFQSGEDIHNHGVLMEQQESVTSGTLDTEDRAFKEISTMKEVNNFEKLTIFEDKTTGCEEAVILEHLETTVDDEIGLVKAGPSFSGNINIISSKVDKFKNIESAEMRVTVELQENFNSCNKVNEHPSSNSINCERIQRAETESEEALKSGTLEPISSSLQNLKEYDKPKEMTDRSLLMPKDGSIGQQGDPETSVNTTQSDVENLSKLQSQTDCNVESQTGQKTSLKCDLSISKSLDSQLMILKKGCELLGTTPRKSSLRSRGSDGCLKKYVHFPEDIRNIRKVHRYDSFDDIICLKIDGDKLEEETEGNK